MNGGKCGICGDAWDDEKPRQNEDGGRYGLGRVYRKYTKASQDRNITALDSSVPIEAVFRMILKF